MLIPTIQDLAAPSFQHQLAPGKTSQLFLGSPMSSHFGEAFRMLMRGLEIPSKSDDCRALGGFYTSAQTSQPY
jgi:hypothetical protein